MSESISAWQRVAAITAAATSVLAAEGYISPPATAQTVTHSASGGETLPRCYPEPLNPQYSYGPSSVIPQRKNYPNDQAFLDALNKHSSAQEAYIAATNPQPISTPVVNGIPEGMPTAPLSSNIHDSIVKITAPEYYGSGFVAKDSKGNDVVVTAAHMTEAPYKSLTISAEDGRTVHPTGGCFMFENISLNNTTDVTSEFFGKFYNEDDGSATGVDIAILTIPQSLGAKALNITNKPISRGDWVRFDNFQTGSTIAQPADFFGLVTASQPYSLPEVLTGIEYPTQPAQDPTEDRFEPGGSGGVVTVDGKVVGVSYSADGYKTGSYESPSDVNSSYNMTFPGAIYGEQTGFTPDSVTLDGVNTIKLALKSPKA